jgi:hypothetical protein
VGKYTPVIPPVNPNPGFSARARNRGGSSFLDLKRRGLAMGPELAVADGALGFWQAVEEVWPKTRSAPVCAGEKTPHNQPARC